MTSRRAYLVGLAAVVAGCTDSQSTPTDTSTRTPTDARTRTPTATRTPRDTGAVSGSWTHLDGDAGGTRATGTPPLDAGLNGAWTVEFGGSVLGVRLAGDTLYTTTERQLEGRRLDDGGVAWTLAFDGTVRLGAARPDAVYCTVGESEPTLHALAPAMGGSPAVRWSTDGLRFRRADADLVVATTEDNGRLAALEPDGTERWSVTPDGLVGASGSFGPVVLGPGHVHAVVEGESMTWVTGIDRTAPEQGWVGEDPNQGGVLAASDRVVVSGGSGPEVSGFSPDGSLLWRYEVSGRVDTVAVANERVLVGTADGSRSTAMLSDTGDLFWSYEGGVVAAVDTALAYASTSSGVAALDAEDGSVRWELDTEPGQVVPADGGLLVARPRDAGAELQLFV